eukprot:6199734-Pleurochrysis_carterae.AAC.1
MPDSSKRDLEQQRQYLCLHREKAPEQPASASHIDAHRGKKNLEYESWAKIASQYIRVALKLGRWGEEQMKHLIAGPLEGQQVEHHTEKVRHIPHADKKHEQDETKTLRVPSKGRHSSMHTQQSHFQLALIGNHH